MRCLLLFFICCLAFSQNTIHVLKVKGTLRPFVIEDSILANLEILYNANNEDKIKFQIEYVSNFSEVFKKIHTYEKDHVMAISSISITDKRKENYDFSSPYIKTKECILTHHSIDNNWSSNGRKIGYVKGTIEEIRAKELAKKYPVKLVGFSSFVERNKGIKTNLVDYYIGESAHYWNDPNVKVVHTFSNRIGQGLGILFIKGSNLKLKLNKYVEYFSTSKGFYAILQKAFGKNYQRHFYTDSLK